MIQQQVFHNIPATIALRKDGDNAQVAFRYEHTKALIENDGSASWTKDSLMLNDVEYKYGVWHNVNEELKTFLNSYMKY